MQYQPSLLDGFIAEAELIPASPSRRPEPKVSVAQLVQLALGAGVDAVCEWLLIKRS
ncbi:MULTISPECIES: hypothetical protein [unclassified Streptomyces]|uniref:hypothetical protein n=1 Tax=Streptomyces sp. SID8354 TaxID=2690339 RepID=UPI0003AADC0B|nr:MULTISPECIES: hypothetical protein [unclassified Streptomyces]